MRFIKYIIKQAGYIAAVSVLMFGGILLGIYFVTTDSQPQDAAVLTPMVTVPVSFTCGVLLCKLFNRKQKADRQLITPER